MRISTQYRNFLATVMRINRRFNVFQKVYILYIANSFL